MTVASSGGSAGGRSKSSGRLLQDSDPWVVGIWVVGLRPPCHMSLSTATIWQQLPSQWENTREREPGREASLLPPNIRSDIFITFVIFYSLEMSHEAQSILGSEEVTNQGHEYQEAKMTEGHLSLYLLYTSSFASGFFCAILFLWNLFILFVWLWIIHSYHYM